MANPQRGPLDFLRRAFRGEELEKVLLEDTCVPDSFLQRYGIDLVSWQSIDFKKHACCLRMLNCHLMNES